MDFFATINSFYVFIGSLVLGLAGGFLGTFAVLRKQGLMGDVLAHAALPGVAIAFLIMKTKFLPGLLLGAMISSLLAAFLVYFLFTKTKLKMDTAMASVLSSFFGTGVLILTYIQKLPIASQSGLDSFMFGQAAALLKNDVIMMVSVVAVILFFLLLFWKELKLFTFDPEFAVVLGYKKIFLELMFLTIFVSAILIALQAVGVVLTAALFITPAVAALFWSNKLFNVFLLSGFFGMLSGVSGSYLSSVGQNLPTGPLIVLFATLIFILSLFLAPQKGLLHKYFSHRRRSFKTQYENVLGRLYRAQEKGVKILRKVDFIEYINRRRILKFLAKEKLIAIEDDGVFLTDKGMKKAAEIIEKHRLWETYLVSQFNLAPSFVHRDAEEMEHVLNDEMVIELKKILNNPKTDPHGRPIK